MRDEAVETDASSEILESANAATRLFNATLYVCPIGWSTKVYELNGAAAAVWQSLGSCRTVKEVAADQGVGEGDEFLTDAIEMLLDAGLIRRAPKA